MTVIHRAQVRCRSITLLSGRLKHRIAWVRDKVNCVKTRTNVRFGERTFNLGHVPSRSPTITRVGLTATKRKPPPHLSFGAYLRANLSVYGLTKKYNLSLVYVRSRPRLAVTPAKPCLPLFLVALESSRRFGRDLDATRIAHFPLNPVAGRLTLSLAHLTK